jgi:alpha-mannosidase
LGQFIGGHHASQNLSSALFTHRIDDAAHIEMIYWSAPGRSKPGFDEAKRQLNGRGKKATKGMEFGPSCKHNDLPFAASIAVL